jgi:hypothetical protein
MAMVIFRLYEQSKSGESPILQAAGTWPPIPREKPARYSGCRFLTASGGSVTLGQAPYASHKK